MLKSSPAHNPSARHSIALDWPSRLWLATMCMANGMAFALIFLVMVMFKRFGLNNATITFNLSLVCLPWVARPLCHLLVRRTAPDKGVWMLACEAIFAVATVVMAATLYTGYWFQWTMLMLLVASAAGMVHGVMCESLYKDLTRNTWSVALRPLYVVYHALALLIALGVMTMVAGNIEVMTRNTDAAWTATLRLVALMGAALMAVNALLLKLRGTPHPAIDTITDVDSWRELRAALHLFLGRRSLSVGSLFAFCFLLPQGFNLSVSTLFLIDSTHRGGLGLSPQEYGLTLGTVGVLGLVAGCLICMRIAKLWQLRNIVVPLSLANFLPAISMVVLSQTSLRSINIIGFWIFVGHAGMGIALITAVAFIARYSCGRYKVTFYSTGIALISLGMGMASLYSGTLQRYYGYDRYFAIALACCALSPIAALVLRLVCFRNTSPGQENKQ